MAKKNARRADRRNRRGPALIKALLYGILSLGLYAAVFLNEDFVSNTWAKGGVYTVLPIATVFVFSFIHGNFASHLMTSVGLVAKKK